MVFKINVSLERNGVFMRYKEDDISRGLYELNKDRLYWENNPSLLNDNSKWATLIYYIWMIKRLITKLKNIEVIDEINVSNVRIDNELNEYDFEVIPKVAVYTCVAGGYDELWEPLYKSQYCDFYAITDSKINKQSVWNWIDYHEYQDMVDVDVNPNPIYINRWFKMHPHKVFAQYDYSVYIDGNVQVVADIMPLVLRMIQENKFFGIHKHYVRKYLKTEAKAILKYKKNIDGDLLKKQINEYKKCGYDDDIPLLEATIMIRKHNESKCIAIMEDWWREFLKYIPRDQISLPYVLWKNGLSLDNLSILGGNEYMNPRFAIKRHK